MTKKRKADPETATQPEWQNTPKQAEPYKIAILGTASSSVHNAPFNDPSWKIWDMSANWQYKRRFDLWFEIHTPEILMLHQGGHEYINFLRSAGKSVLVAFPSEVWPEATLFPYQEIINKYGDYFICTAAWELAFALYQHEIYQAKGHPGIGEIALFGIDMATEGSEYSKQKPNVEYWIGFLRAKGIKVTVAAQSPICRVNAPYGLSNPKLSREFTEKLLELNSLIPKKETQFNALRDEILQLKAVRDQLQQVSDRWCL